jgi:SnoaL-like domain
MTTPLDSKLAQAAPGPATVPDDGIRQVLSRLYEVISFPEGGEPDWDGMSEVFSHHARITRITPEGTDYFDLPTFQAMAQELLRLGAYTAFHEREVACRIEQFGDVAHVTSAYETKRHPDAVASLSCGVNSLQLVRERNAWRVVSLCWDDEALKDRDVRALVAGGHRG